MVRSPAYDRTLEVVGELTKVLHACEDTGAYDGHDKMLIRQLGILLYLLNRPRTDKVVESLTPFLPAMDADLQMLLRRLAGQGQGLA